MSYEDDDVDSRLEPADGMDAPDDDDEIDEKAMDGTSEDKIGDIDNRGSESMVDRTPEDNTEHGDDEDELRSQGTEDDASHAKPAVKATPTKRTPPTRRSTIGGGSGAKKARTPSVAGLTIPFRTVKKAMKLDHDTPIVQNEAAIMTTLAAELFLKSLSKRSFRNAKNRGRNTIRYEDVAEARTNDPALYFLEMLLP